MKRGSHEITSDWTKCRILFSSGPRRNFIIYFLGENFFPPLNTASKWQDSLLNVNVATVKEGGGYENLKWKYVVCYVKKVNATKRRSRPRPPFWCTIQLRAGHQHSPFGPLTPCSLCVALLSLPQAFSTTPLPPPPLSAEVSLFIKSLQCKSSFGKTLCSWETPLSLPLRSSALLSWDSSLAYVHYIV